MLIEKVSSASTNKMKNINLFASLLFTLLIVTQASSQESLQEKYNSLIESSETFQQYKVVPKTSLNAFWSETMDSLNHANSTISDLSLNVTSQQDSIQALNSRLAVIQNGLDESLELNDTIYFVGMPFSKLGYHIMVWLIIIALTLLSLMVYFMFIRSNKQTTRFKRELEGLNTEFENHKNESREKQMKLKRELQTAMNQLSEKRS